MVSLVETGMNPLQNPCGAVSRLFLFLLPCTLEFPAAVPASMGIHGFANMLCATEWLAGQKWNCTISPTAALMVLGSNILLPFLLPTWIGCTFMLPLGVAGFVDEVVVFIPDMDIDIEDDDCAAAADADRTVAAAMARTVLDVEKSMAKCR